MVVNHGARAETDACIWCRCSAFMPDHSPGGVRSPHVAAVISLLEQAHLTKVSICKHIRHHAATGSDGMPRAGQGASRPCRQHAHLRQ